MSFAAFGTISGSQAAFGTNVRATGSYLKAGTVSTVTSIEAIKPLNEYILKFDKFKEMLLLKPDDYVQAIEMAEQPKEPAEI